MTTSRKSRTDRDNERPAELGRRERAEPGPGQCLVRVTAAPWNPLDLLRAREEII